jgi:hypothetical protein
MGNFSFGAARKQAEQEGVLSSGNTFKYKEGDNRLRLMSECLPHPGEYQGRSNFKWLCYVLDRLDGKVKVHFMPHSVYKQIEALQANPDYFFEEVPMPYDLTIRAVKAGTKEVEYSVIPARKETPLSRDEIAALSEQKPLAELQWKIREKTNKGEDEHDHQSQVRGVASQVSQPLNDSDVPF